MSHPGAQIRFCDRRANPYFDHHRGAYDAMKDPINCTWGFHRPPPLVEGVAACGTTADEILRSRMQEVARQWTVQPNAGLFERYQGSQLWSTRNSVYDLYPKYI